MQIADSHEAETQQTAAEQLKSALESLLFVAGRPLERAELRRLLAINEGQLEATLATLAAECEKRGVRVQRLGNQVQLVSAPENARYIAAFLGLPSQVKLTTAALETLAVITYRQPITRSQIETIRGVNSDRALASLIAHSLVNEIGRAATVGRPALFATTPEFLQQFGLTSLEHLPTLDLPGESLQALESLPNGADHRAPAANGHSERSIAEPQPSEQSAISPARQEGEEESG
ncbi:MAG TPA: SMC-Scp complex subunit ScpB [Ktedonobacterales bacterium]|jgi:segregation and condensation protein B